MEGLSVGVGGRFDLEGGVFDGYLEILGLYCMIVWAAMIPLFILLTVRNLAHGVIPAPPGVVRFATGWAGTLIAVAYVTVTGSVFVQFLPAFTGY